MYYSYHATVEQCQGKKLYTRPSSWKCQLSAVHYGCTLAIIACDHYYAFVPLKLEKRNDLEKKLSEERVHGKINYLGNVQFIAELFKLRMVSDTIVHECIRRLLRSTSDETSLECVSVLLSTSGKYLDKQKAKVIISL